MKRILFLFIILINTVSGQQWLPSGAKWHYTLAHYGTTLQDFLTIEYSRDTVINGVNSKILTKNAEVCDGRPFEEFTYEAGGKIYFYNGNDSTFQSLYDWNMIAGDSSYFTVSNFSLTDTLFFRIDSVVPAIINGNTFRKYFVSYRSSLRNGFPALVCRANSQWLEGIGDLQYMFPYYYGFCDWEWASPIRCYYDSIVGLIDFDPIQDCEYITTDVNENVHSDLVSAFPNPANDLLKLNCEILKYEITSTTGQVIKNGGEVRQIDLSSFDAGIYILRLTTSSGKYMRRIIKN